ncbi:MAG: hypothetical protein ACI88A_001395 [Paraglaciecola sp.]|jgi:hypothetical protein
MKTTAKKALVAAAITLMSINTLQAATNLAELSDELEIMTNILHTSLKQNSPNKGIRLRSVNVTYLAEQGVLFEINTTGAGGGFDFNFDGMFDGFTLPSAPVAPVPPVRMSGGRVQIDMDEEELEHFVEDALERAQDQLQESREQLRELAEQQREIAWEQRDYDRKRRDLEFEKRNADADDRKKIDSKLSKLAAETKLLDAKRVEVERYGKKLEAEQQQQAEQRLAAKKQQYSEFLAGFENSIANVLCRYGAGVKALSENENISFVLSDFGSMEAEGHKSKQDKIYVFKYKDVQACVRDKMTQQKLLAGANTYLF